MTKSLLLLRLALGAVLAFAATSAFAQADPPSRVGRLSYMEGTVSFHTADQDQWSPATLNYPVVTGTSFWTEPGSRAELQVGSAEFRLDETTALDVRALDDHTTRLELEQGVLNVHLRAPPRGSVEVMTPLGIVDLVAAGSYHIDAGHSDQATPPERVEVTVLEGRAEASGLHHRIEILPSERAIINGDPRTYTIAEGGTTPFDDWALQRERREQALAASEYVSPEVTGYQDLDDYGQWGRNPSYGTVWYPTAVPVGWAPYRYGHWAWVPPWGWTWIDDAPWGFAPFHYGRWVDIDGRWGWCPGVVAARPVYAPALVAFIGGSGWNVTLSSGPAFAAVGWVPLAPFEVYHPYYRTSVTYVRNVNITNVHETQINQITNVTNVTHVTNVTNVTNVNVVQHFANQRAATVVPANAFTGAAPVHRAALALHQDELAHAPVTPAVAHLQPSPASRVGIAVPAAAETVPHPNAPATVARTPAPGAPPPGGEGRRAERQPELPHAPGPPVAARPAAPMPTPGATPRIEASPRSAPGTQASPPPTAAVTRPPAQARAPLPQQQPSTAPRIEASPRSAPGTQASPPPTAAVTPPPVQARAPLPQPQPSTAPRIDASPRPVPSAAAPPHPAAATPSLPVQVARPSPPPGQVARPSPPPVQVARPSPPPGQVARPSPPPGQMARPAPPLQNTAASTPRPPIVPIERPAQQTHLAPTPQGWVRSAPPPAPPPQPHAAPPHPAPAQGHNPKDERKPGG